MSEIKTKVSSGLMWGGIMSLSQQFLGLIITIIITRALNPSDYGLIGMLTIFTALATTLQDGGLIWALTNIKDISREQYSTIFWFNIIISALLYIVLFCSSPLIARYYHQPELLWLSRYVFLGIFFSGFSIVQSTYLYKELRVKERALSAIIAQVIAGGVGILMAYNGFSYWGIATQGVLYILVNSIVLWLFSPFRPLFSFDKNFIVSVLPNGIRFLIPNICAIIGDNIFSVILGRKYSVRDVGNYGQASKWNTTGYSIILSMVRNVTQPLLVSYKDDKIQYLNVFRKLFKVTAFMIFPIMLTLALSSSDLIAVILTTKWIESARILRILCLGGIISTLNTMMSYFVMSLNKSKLYMAMGVMTSIVTVIAALVSASWGIYALAQSYVLVGAIFFIVYFILIRRSHGYSIRMLISDIAPIAFVTFGAVIVSFYVFRGLSNVTLKLFGECLLSILIYLGIMFITGNETMIVLLRTLQSKFYKNGK